MCQLFKESFLFVGQNKLNKSVFIIIDRIPILVIQLNNLFKNLLFPLHLHHIILATLIYLLSIVDVKVVPFRFAQLTLLFWKLFVKPMFFLFYVLIRHLKLFLWLIGFLGIHNLRHKFFQLKKVKFKLVDFVLRNINLIYYLFSKRFV